MSKPISIDGDGALGFTLLGTKWFKVKDPEKGVMIKDFDKKIADFAITSSLGFSKVDLSLKIYDENNQPWYTIEKVSIPNRGFSTTSFQLRAKLLLISTQGVHDEKDISTCIKSH